ncbi:bactofilin family protein [Novispirillum sp. DQ9]|uniref:bactofilin family protein n=1 Tax=Novispirillum sp. DQ9 TaxID=3398612 RepID=UPI003C7CE2C5
MFSKGSKTPSREHKAEAGGRGVPSIISADLTITGDLVSEGEIQVDGTIDGDIRCKALIIGVDGAVTGEVEAESVRLHGKVTGQLRAKTVFLAATAHMIGDITHESLAIEPGAFMEGHCRRMTEATKLGATAKKPDLTVAPVKPLPKVESDKDEDNKAAAVL